MSTFCPSSLRWLQASACLQGVLDKIWELFKDDGAGACAEYRYQLLPEKFHATLHTSTSLHFSQGVWNAWGIGSSNTSGRWQKPGKVYSPDVYCETTAKKLKLFSVLVSPSAVKLDLVAHIEGQTNKITRDVSIAIDCTTGLVLVIVWLDMTTQNLKKRAEIWHVYFSNIHFHKRWCLYPKRQTGTSVIVNLCSPQPVPASAQLDLWPTLPLLSPHPWGAITCLLLLLVKNRPSLFHP